MQSDFHLVSTTLENHKCQLDLIWMHFAPNDDYILFQAQITGDENNFFCKFFRRAATPLIN